MEGLLEITKYEGEGYMPLIDFDAWRVAVLRYCDELLPQNICKLQKHDETDEVFVLLQGQCTLYIANGQEKPERIFKQPMEPMKLYNIKKSTWHSHTLSRDGMVLIVENQNTGIHNSPECMLDDKQREALL